MAERTKPPFSSIALPAIVAGIAAGVAQSGGRDLEQTAIVAGIAAGVALVAAFVVHTFLR